MSSRYSLRCMMMAVFLCLSFTFGMAPNGPALVSFKSEGDQGSFTLRKEFHPAIAEIGLQVFTTEVNSPEIKKVHEQRGPANQPLVWMIKDAGGKPAQDQIYLCAIELKPLSGTSYFLVGRIMQTGQTGQTGNEREFSMLEERPDNLPGSKPEEFHKSLTQVMPDNGAAWFFYGQTIHQKSGYLGYSVLAPPPPPPAAPTPGLAIKEIPLSKEEQKQIAEEEKQRKIKEAAFREDLKVAQPAFLKAAELADDCQIKDTAMAYLAKIASDLEDDEQQSELLLKRIASPCATNSGKAESYHVLGVKRWECAYNLTSKYANKKAAAPFHFRAITNPAEKQKLGNCITTAVEYLEKAIEADPKFPDAFFYKSLIYREKQKVTANPAERKRQNDEAAKLTARGMELMKQMENSQTK